MTMVVKSNVLEMDKDDVLAHYGVAGMKWGKRKGSVDKATNGVRSARKEIYKNAGQGLVGKGRKGQLVAAGILMGPSGLSGKVGYELAKSAGYSKGKSVAIGLLAGAPGGMVAAEISARRTAK